MATTYQEALRQTLDAIAEGARPLQLHMDTYTLLWGRYEGDFKYLLEKFPDAWDTADAADPYGGKLYVLPLARLVGSLAAAMTAASDALEGKTGSEYVLTEHADLAGFVVSRTSPYCGKPGKYCENYTLGDYGDRQGRIKMAAIILEQAVSSVHFPQDPGSGPGTPPKP